MAITLYHPQLKQTIEVPDEGAAKVLADSGWTTKVPKGQPDVPRGQQPDSQESKEA